MAPRFEMTAEDRSTVSSASLAGTRHVLYFYPEDDTPGCTRQACGLRDRWTDIVATGVEVFGVSPDSVERHVAFREKYALPYRLLADDGHRAADDYGVWVEKDSGGSRHQGNERTTFVIGPDGTVEHVLARVKPDAHAQQLLDALAP